MVATDEPGKRGRPGVARSAAVADGAPAGVPGGMARRTAGAVRDRPARRSRGAQGVRQEAGGAAAARSRQASGPWSRSLRRAGDPPPDGRGRDQAAVLLGRDRRPRGPGPVQPRERLGGAEAALPARVAAQARFDAVVPAPLATALAATLSHAAGRPEGHLLLLLKAAHPKARRVDRRPSRTRDRGR